MYSVEALEATQKRIDYLKVKMCCANEYQHVIYKYEITGLLYARDLLRQVVEHDEDEELSQLADSVAREYYSSQED